MIKLNKTQEAKYEMMRQYIELGKKIRIDWNNNVTNIHVLSSIYINASGLHLNGYRSYPTNEVINERIEPDQLHQVYCAMRRWDDEFKSYDDKKREDSKKAKKSYPKFVEEEEPKAVTFSVERLYTIRANAINNRNKAERNSPLFCRFDTQAKMIEKLLHSVDVPVLVDMTEQSREQDEERTSFGEILSMRKKSIDTLFQRTNLSDGTTRSVLEGKRAAYTEMLEAYQRTHGGVK